MSTKGKNYHVDRNKSSLKYGTTMTPSYDNLTGKDRKLGRYTKNNRSDNDLIIHDGIEITRNENKIRNHLKSSIDFNETRVLKSMRIEDLKSKY